MKLIHSIPSLPASLSWFNLSQQLRTTQLHQFLPAGWRIGREKKPQKPQKNTKTHKKLMG